GAPTDWLWAHPASGFGDSRYAEAFFAFAPIDAIITQPFAGHGRSVENEAEYPGKFFELSEALGPNTCETCNTYNMLKLTRHLFCWDPRAEYADYYERALYNHIL